MAIPDQRDKLSAPWEPKAKDLLAEIRLLIAEVREWPSHPSADGIKMPHDAESLHNRDFLQILALKRAQIVRLVGQLDILLEEKGFDDKNPGMAQAEHHTFGTYDTHYDPRKIHKGVLIQICRRPIIEEDLPARVVLYIKIADEDDILIRESGGGIGYHYHYAKNDGSRSNLLIAWDTRAKCDHAVRGIFGERHAAEGKFAARPENWGTKKRSSVHAACRPDLQNWSLTEFRNASDDAFPVWPCDAVLTPRETVPKKVTSRSAHRRDNRRAAKNR